MTKHPVVSIIFPTLNGWEDTRRCLQSISKLNYPKNKIEVIVVDNASKKTQNSKLKTQNYNLKLKIIRNNTNFGFARAVNQGIKRAQGDYIFVTNNDMIFSRSFLSELVGFAEKNPTVGIVGGKIYYQKPENKLLFTGLSFNPWTGSIKKLPNPNQTKETEWVQGCTMLVKKDVVKKIGIFDPDYFYTFEDLDFCKRAKKAGFKIFYFPKAVAWHKEGGTIDKMGFRKKAYELYKAKFRYIFKNCSPLQILSTTLIQFFVVAPYRKLIVRDKYFFIRPMIKGYLDNLI